MDQLALETERQSSAAVVSVGERLRALQEAGLLIPTGAGRLPVNTAEIDRLTALARVVAPPEALA